MFVTWRKRPVKGHGGGPFILGEPDLRNSDCKTPWHGLLRCDHTGEGRVAWTALVMHAERRDGKPRQVVLARFATIRSCCIGDRFKRAAWWHDVEDRYSGWPEWAFEDLRTEPLVTLWARDRVAILAKLREVVPKADRESIAAFANFAAKAKAEHDARFDELYEKLRRNGEEAIRARKEQERVHKEEQERFYREFLAQMGMADPSADVASLHTLGLESSATIEQIRAAHRRLVKLHHPDRGGDPAQFREVQVAYERLVAAHGRLATA